MSPGWWSARVCAPRDVPLVWHRVFVHAFADESKESRFTFAAALCPTRDLDRARVALRGLRLARQRRLHFKRESPRQRHVILAELDRLGLGFVIYECARGVGERQARPAALEQMVTDLVDRGVTRLVIERDESLDVHDRRKLREVTAKVGCRDTFTYELLQAHEDPLLWAADAAAWSWTKGGEWRRRVRSMVVCVVKV